MNQDKRKAPRVTFKGLVHCSRVDVSRLSHNEQMGRTLDISEAGILLEVQQHFPILSQIDLGIAVGDKIINAKGKVVHLSEAENQRIRMGIHFLEISEEDKQVIREYCKKRNHNNQS